MKIKLGSPVRIRTESEAWWKKYLINNGLTTVTGSKFYIKDFLPFFLNKDLVVGTMSIMDNCNAIHANYITYTCCTLDEDPDHKITVREEMSYLVGVEGMLEYFNL